MLPRITIFVKENRKEIILLIGVLLISSLSFAFGYIVAKTEERNYLEFEDLVINQTDENTGARWNNS